MNTELPKQGSANNLGIVAVVMGVLCIAVAVIMTYHGKTMSLGNIPIAASLAFLVAGLILIIASLVGYSKQKHQQVSIRVWHILVPVLIVFLTVYVSTRYSLQGDDKYTVLIDLILIMLALTGMIGYGIYRWISRGVADRVALAMKEGRNFTRAQVETALGLSSYNQYKNEVKRTDGMNDVWKKLSKIQSKREDKESREAERKPTDVDMTCLQDAIASATRALGLLKGLKEDKYEMLICICKNNLAYYLAEKRRRKGKIDEGEKKLAVEYATFIWERIQKYPDHKAAWADTYKFVGEQFLSKSD